MIAFILEYNADNPTYIFSNEEAANDTLLALKKLYPNVQWTIKTWSQSQIETSVPQELINEYNAKFNTGDIDSSSNSDYYNHSDDQYSSSDSESDFE